MQHLDDSLKEVFATYQWVELLPHDWFAAAIIGAMRTGVNDLIRGSTRDRRAERNMRNDTSGVLAEILVIRQVEKALPSQELNYQLLDLRKTTDMLDVQVAGSESGLEAKSVLLLEEVRRHDFAINEIAANRSKRRRAMGYIGVLMAMGSRYALLSRVVPMDEVKSWPLKTYGEHKDPAHAMNLRDFAVKHAGLPKDKPLAIIEDFLERTLMVDPRAIEDVYMRAHTVMRVQLELQMKGHETSVGPKLEELVRALRSQGEAAD
ncbi:MAG TPA: hypothetical protein VGG75_30700 [Trebonia sp.]|jgi:hypothetical protein